MGKWTIVVMDRTTSTPKAALGCFYEKEDAESFAQANDMTDLAEEWDIEPGWMELVVCEFVG